MKNITKIITVKNNWLRILSKFFYSLLFFSDNLLDKFFNRHLNEHLKEKINLKNDLSPEEIEFFYFMEHDYNNDSKLDGLELLAAIKHSALSDELDSNLTSFMTNKERNENEIKIYTGIKFALIALLFIHNLFIIFFLFQFIIDIIDEILKEDDINGDGYLSYLEYVFARRRDDSNDRTKDEH
jgi:hypothetical protein